MRKTKTAMRTDLGSLSQDMINEFEEQELQDKKVSVFVTSDEEPTKVQQEYVLMFVENFQAISKQLTNREIQVLLSIVKFSQYKNVFKITQTTIAKDTGIQRSNVSVIMKKLREKNYILYDEEQEIEYVNPYIFLKGGIKEFKSTNLFHKTKEKEKQLSFEGFSNPF